MKTTQFFSNRLKCYVSITLTYTKIVYVTADAEVISIDRDSSYHFNTDGLNRCQELFDDPRFDYWYNIELENSK